MKYTIDAQGKKIGRIASAAAALLMGKSSTSFAKNVVSDTHVEIIHAKDTDVTAKKKITDVYVTYTGHRGGLKSESLGELINRRGLTEVLQRAIYRMLPDNKLRDRRMKNLHIKE
jgi:large subunit ribosomal protein L13